MRWVAQEWKRPPAGPEVYALQLAAGPNAVSRELEALPFAHVIPSFGDAEQDLRRLLTGLTQAGMQPGFERSRIPATGATETGTHASSHLARLWAAGEISRLAETGAPADREEAIRLAAARRLVTPVSAAVVLESVQQYKDANLQPVDPDSMPSTTTTVPEPETWLLIAVGVLLLLSTHARRRIRPQPATAE